MVYNFKNLTTNILQSDSKRRAMVVNLDRETSGISIFFSSVIQSRFPNTYISTSDNLVFFKDGKSVVKSQKIYIIEFNNFSLGLSAILFSWLGGSSKKSRKISKPSREALENYINLIKNIWLSIQIIERSAFHFCFLSGKDQAVLGFLSFGNFAN